MTILKNLKKEYLKENVYEKINELSIDSSIENDLFEIIDELIDEFEYDNLIIDFDECIDLFKIDELLKELFNNEIYYDFYLGQITNKINYRYYDDLIELYNIYNDYLYCNIIFENDIDEFENYYGIKLTFNDFNYYNSNDDLIFYNSSLNNYYTMNYYDLDEKIDIDDIIENILRFENI